MFKLIEHLGKDGQSSIQTCGELQNEPIVPRSNDAVLTNMIDPSLKRTIALCSAHCASEECCLYFEHFLLSCPYWMSRAISCSRHTPTKEC